jgi:hypothetical protein
MWHFSREKTGRAIPNQLNTIRTTSNLTNIIFFFLENAGKISAHYAVSNV